MRLSARPQDDDEEDELSSFWLITYSDMTTLLLAFFLLMFSFTVLSEREGAELVRSLNAQGQQRRAVALEETARQIADRFRSGDEHAYVETGKTEVTVVLPSSVTFRSGESTLSPEARAALVQVAAILAAAPNAVIVEGHTDDVPVRGGAPGGNWQLSAARAQSVIRLLIEQGVDPRRLQVVGHGETRPRQAGTTEEARRANRRIELKLLREEE